MEKSIAEAIKKGRKKKGLSQRDLAKLLGCASGAVSEWELAKKNPYGDTMIKIIHVLDLVPEFFPGYIKEENVITHDQKDDLLEELERLRKDNLEQKKDNLERKKENLENKKEIKELTALVKSLAEKINQ